MIHAGGVAVADGIAVAVKVAAFVTVGVLDNKAVGVAETGVDVREAVAGIDVAPLERYTFPVVMMFALRGLLTTLTRVDVS